MDLVFSAHKSVSYLHLWSIVPVFEEPMEAKGHKFEQSLDDKDNGEHVVAVLQNLLQILQEHRHQHVKDISHTEYFPN